VAVFQKRKREVGQRAYRVEGAGNRPRVGWSRKRTGSKERAEGEERGREECQSMASRVGDGRESGVTT
jgi:hypothetical protein